MNSLLFFLLQSWGAVENTAIKVAWSVGTLCWVLCALFGLIGAIRIYNKWQLGAHCFRVDAEIAGWMGASLFFLAARTFIAIVL